MSSSGLDPGEMKSAMRPMKVPRPVYKFALVGLVAVLMAAALLTPSLQKREPEYRPKCQANLRTISAALQQYAREHGGNFPDSLVELLQVDEFIADFLVCPATKQSPAKGSTTRQVMEELRINGPISYIYRGRNMNLSTAPDAVLVFEPADHHARGRGVVLVDGTVDFVDASEWIAPELNTGHNLPRGGSGE